MTEPPTDETRGFVPVTLQDGSWRTIDGDVVPWYEVQTGLLAEAELQGAMGRVLSVYGVSDVVVDAFDQLRKELRHPSPEED